MDQGEVLTSVGVDVGTATTKIIFSRLRFQNLGLGLGVPRVRLAGREVLWRSQLQETPVEGERLLTERLLAFLRQAYGQAGIDPAEVRSGGVIITGEAARKENARALLDLLAREAGDFVVATAGPQLEAIIAGRGSGAATRSERTGGTVAAVDIGGGTSNIAIFRNGQVRDTACLNLGGKSLRLEPRTGRLLSVTAAAQAVLEKHSLTLRPGQALDLAALRRVGEVLAGAVAAGVTGAAEVIGLTGVYNGTPLRGGYALQEVMVSGGVANDLYSPGPVNLEAALRYGDIGPALAWGLAGALTARGQRLATPVETSFATVIGVGVHTLSLSGSTIRITSPDLLPLRNVPVIRPFPHAAPCDRAAWAREVSRHLHWQAPDGPVAVSVGRLEDLSFDGLQSVAAGIEEGLADILEQGHPLVVVTEQDVAKALGLLMTSLVPVITVDELQVADGSFIDIGRPLYGGAVVPVVIKTLVFPT